MRLSRVRNLIFPWKHAYRLKKAKTRNTIFYKIRAIEHDIKEIYLCIEGIEANKANKRGRPYKPTKK
jgi:hypothetical protein|tara:strand:- start:87 stop:287 length:201 start_codon:yes stop_codon:yes gene_type:complete